MARTLLLRVLCIYFRQLRLSNAVVMWSVVLITSTDVFPHHWPKRVYGPLKFGKRQSPRFFSRKKRKKKKKKKENLNFQHPEFCFITLMGFSITSTVERVLGITELVDLICEQSPRYGSTEWSIYSSYDGSSPGLSSYGALPALSRTTRFLSKRALRVLWRHLDSFWPLLRLLPGDLLDVGTSPRHLEEQDYDQYKVWSVLMPPSA
jgi:hypothetical protein